MGVEFEMQEETVDALGNKVKVKGPKKKLSRKEIKAMSKARAAKLAAGNDITTDSDWDLDVYIGADPDAAKKAEREAKKAAKRTVRELDRLHRSAHAHTNKAFVLI